MSVDYGEAELEMQAQAMAEKALAALPESARAAKIAKVKEGILKRLREQVAKGTAAAPGGASPTAAGAAAPGAMPGALPGVGSEGGAVPPPPGAAPPPPGGLGAAAPPPPPAPPPEDGTSFGDKMDGIEALGDETWFADPVIRRSLREAVVAAHAEQKILVGAPADEIRRICPGGGRVLGAGAVLRLGGSTLGGYGEADIAYAYRQLSRALHPDKNPDIPEAPDAFKRLSEAADELRQGLQEARNTLRALCIAMGTMVSPEMLERPQQALFAEATRVLYAVLSLSGEGEVPVLALNRGVAAFTSSVAYGNCQAQLLLSEWYDQNRLLDLFAGPQIRTAYDCARKRLRAQFLCALNRATLAEAKRHNDCVRGNWQAVMMQFPEIGLWRELYDKIRMRVWSREEQKRERGSMWDDEEGPRASAWAKTWRGRMAAILPRGIDAAVPWTDPDVRQLCTTLWKDIATWARTPEVDAERHLQLFTAEQPPDEWAFVPAADLLLVVGEGVVGITAEGLVGENKPGHERITWAEALEGKHEKKKKEKEKDKDKDKDKDREDGKGDGEKERDGKSKKRLENDPNFDWEQVWRTRVQANKARKTTRGSSPVSRTARSGSRSRRRTSRSRERPKKSRSRARRRAASRSRERRAARSRSRRKAVEDSD